MHGWLRSFWSLTIRDRLIRGKQLHMGGQTDEWMRDCADGWMNECMGGWNGWMEWMDRWMECMDGMDGWNGWME